MRRKNVLVFLLGLTLSVLIKTYAIAQPMNFKTFDYVVQPGDSIWKICVKYEVGVSEVLSVNPQITNPALIYPKHIVKVPDLRDIKKFESEVVKLANIERSKNGLKPLTSNWQLARTARYKSFDMQDNKYFSHTSPSYGSPFKMIRDFGINYRTAGENIAYGYSTPSEVMKGWMNSPGHRQNILNSKFQQIGVGMVKSQNGTLYWTQMFIGW